VGKVSQPSNFHLPSLCETPTTQSFIRRTAVRPAENWKLEGCDTFALPGMRRIAQHRGWVLQLCNFHLLLKLRALRHGVRYALRGGAVREEIHQLIRIALELPEGRRLTRAIERLTLLSHGDCGTPRMRTTVREFLGGLEYYRAHLLHPRLGLPRTTNSVESMCRILRELFRSSRAGSNPSSVLLWATALIRLRPRVTCNGQ